MRRRGRRKFGNARQHGLHQWAMLFAAQLGYGAHRALDQIRATFWTPALGGRTQQLEGGLAVPAGGGNTAVIYAGLIGDHPGDGLVDGHAPVQEAGVGGAVLDAKGISAA